MPSNPCILLVDDDDLFREMLLIMFQRERPHCQLIPICDGQAAYTHYQQHGADLIVTDDMMPILSGTALVQRLRAEQHTVPIVMLTSRNTTRDLLVPDAYTVVAAKPLPLRTLLAIIDTFLPV